jgi:hypothetical protein
MSSLRLTSTAVRGWVSLAGASALVLFAAAPACSSSDDGTTSSGLPAGCPADPFATNGASSKQIDRATACARYVTALTAKADALKVALTPVPTCPQALDDFEAKLKADPKNADLCIAGYDDGTIFDCECRVASYTSSSDFQNRPCVLGVIPDPSHKCPADAGVDSGADASDAFETSPLDDASPDAADGGGGG